jgi:hypothetical protein
MPLRVLLASALLALLGCQSASVHVDAGACARFPCTRCAAVTEACVGASAVFPYEQRCLPGCQVNSDCPPGSHCAVYYGDTGIRSCTSETTPPTCDPASSGPSCVLEDAHCSIDQRSLVRPFRTASRCGYEFVGCPNGCGSDSTGARCN